ncbi:MAG TPA: 7-carboxy-7-deazaguanine synthase QueE [Myxococcota bacterium]|nr:7-carboxy-7-deazaguanine synthase QueE [Myxococcota bacterium]
MSHVNLVEIFSSVQGEGPYVGASTLFVRFGECDLRCRWCDSPHTWRPAARCRIETRRGSAEFREIANPVAQADAVAAAEALELTAHRFVSLTGGEPLLQPDAAASLARALRGRGPRIYLETHGVATAALERVVDDVDVVSMDWKLASDVRRADDPARGPVRDFHAEHAAFLARACRSAEVFVKVVVTPASTDAELDLVARGVAAVDPKVPLIIQPVTPRGGVKERPSAARLLQIAARLERELADVRVIPQTHPLYGAL